MSMQNAVEYNSNYFETIRSICFRSKDEATNFNADIVNNDDFKSFEYKPKLLGNTEADETNGILENAAIAVSLKYLSNFWGLFEAPLIN